MTRWLLGLVLLVPAPAWAAPATEVHYVMGTYFRITVDEALRPAARGCFQEARRLEAVFSRFDPASELVRVNAAAGESVGVSDDFARLLERAEVLGEATGRTFDVTVGGLTALWRGAEAPPARAALTEARATVGHGRASLRGSALRLAPGTRLDFDGIAKGWVVDRCVARLRAAGATRALVSLGESSLYALGAPAGETHWRLAVRGTDPEAVVGTLHLRDQAASISAVFGGAGRQGRRFGHIVDARTGVPLEDDAVGVVVAGSATDAEAWSKALLVWGAAGVARVERLGATGAVHLAPGGVRRGPGARRAGVFAPLAEAERLAAAAEALR